MPSLTRFELELMAHACGVNTCTPFYRNYFAASPGSDDDVGFYDLVKKGLARQTETPHDMFQYNVYQVTEAGMKLIGWDKLTDEEKAKAAR